MFFKYFQMSLAWAALCFLPACGFVSNHSIYEGIRGNEKTKAAGASHQPATMPNFGQYEKEREALKK